MATTPASHVPASAGPALTLTRGLLLGAGGIVAAVGLWKLLQSGLHNLVATAVWLGGGVIVHDGVLAPVTIALVYVAARVLPPWLRAPAATGAVVLGTVTIVAIPVLGRFGARADNPTLLDRNYGGGWLVLAAVVVAVVAVAGWRRRSANACAEQAGHAERAAPGTGSRRPPI